MAAKRIYSIRSRLILTFVAALTTVIVISLLGTVIALAVFAQKETNLFAQLQLMLETESRAKQVERLVNQGFDDTSLATAAAPQGVGLGLRARVIRTDGSVVYDSHGLNEPLTVGEVVAWLPASSQATVVQQALTIQIGRAHV